MNTYVCAKCGGLAHASHQSARVERFVGSSNESSRWDDRLDPDKERPKTVTYSVTGLGTWHCSGGCQGKVKVRRVKK